MTSIAKPDMSRAWANNGAISTPDSAQIDLGWIAEKPPFQFENFIQNRSDLWVQSLEERGVPEWDSQIIYSKDSLVYRTETVWISLQNSNLNNAPAAGAGFWIPLSELSSPPAVVQAFAGSAAPSGWLLCDGSEVNRTTYARLFSFVGTTFGVGDGSNTFNLPNLVDKSIIGSGSLAATGASIGESSITLEVSNMPSHNHGGSTGGAGSHKHFTANDQQVNGNTLASNNTLTRRSNDIGGDLGTALGGHTKTAHIGNTNTVSDHSHSISSNGSGVSFTNMQPSMGMLWIIKT